MLVGQVVVAVRQPQPGLEPEGGVDVRVVVLEDETLASAFSIGTAPGILYALETTVPLFADALA